MEDTAERALTSLEQLTPAWLTNRLLHTGHLLSGRVTAIHKQRVFSNNAESVQTSISYSADFNPTTAPTRLFVKVANPNEPWNRLEFDFYTRLVPIMQEKRPNQIWSFPFCYDAQYNEYQTGAHFILEDLSETHVSADAPLPPNPTQAKGIIDGLAAFHAFWWENEQLGKSIGQRHTADSLTEMIHWARGNYQKWSVMMGERLSSERKHLLDAVFADWPRLRKKRVLDGKGITLVHRDTHPLNFLYPRDEKENTVKIVDWQSWRVDSALDDLAYMMACHWYPDYRQQLEQPLLRRYHHQLLKHGVENYDWNLCWYDYRASIIRCLFFLLGSWHEERPSAMWWDRLEKGLLAFKELGCMELLSG